MADTFQEELMIAVFLLQNKFAWGQLKRNKKQTNKKKKKKLKEETIILGEERPYHTSKDD